MTYKQARKDNHAFLRHDMHDCVTLRSSLSPRLAHLAQNLASCRNDVEYCIDIDPVRLDIISPPPPSPGLIMRWRDNAKHYLKRIVLGVVGTGVAILIIMVIVDGFRLCNRLLLPEKPKLCTPRTALLIHRKQALNNSNPDDALWGATSPPFYPSPWMDGSGGWAEAYAKAQEFVKQMTLLEKVNLTTGIG